MHDDHAKRDQGRANLNLANDPRTLARRDLQKSLPRRFYKEVAVAVRDGRFAVMLDGRPTRTPAKALLAVPTPMLADALAAEWAAQTDIIDPDTMPLTRLANVSIDGIPGEMAAVIAEIARYGESDLLCYRAEAPDKLVAAQAGIWDPILTASRSRLGAYFLCGAGIVFVEQPAEAKAAVRRAVEAISVQAAGAFKLAALHVMTTLTGSVLLALAVAAGELSVEAAWAAAHVDEDFQMGQWGEDQEALARRARRFGEMQAAARLWQLVEDAQM